MVLEYRTTYIVEAATLIYFRSQLKNIELHERQGTFVLADVPESLIEEYRTGSLRVEPRAFNDTVKWLNTSIKKLILARG
jgi:hypothetical protein